VFKDAIIRELQGLRSENMTYAFGSRLLALTDEVLRDRVLQQLRFTHQYDREYRIPKAHAETFRWVFEPPRDPSKPFTDFQNWLKQDDSHVYWITGKAGSGKSTLLKYIVHHGHCEEFLRCWAGPMPLVIAQFYFWNSGSNIQMSQEGLLRSILYDALRQRPDMIPKVLPDLWTAFQTLRVVQPVWLLTDLMAAFDRLVACATDNYFKICFFVDGLDEFKGDLEALVALFRKATASPNVKACLSSRPWVVFEEAFLTFPSLRLEHLTFCDIQAYITSLFHGHSGFESLARREPSFATTLIDNIATKASGVFLWVYLTVKSLLIGFTNGDRISDLQRRLDEIPGDLEMFYMKIFESIEPAYTRHAYQLFHLIEAAEGELTAMGLYYADQDMDETQLIEAAAAAKILPLSEQEYNDRYDAIKKRLNSRWKGLLEIGPLHSDIEERSRRRITYLHRTARDFLYSPEISTRMKSPIPRSDLHLILAGSCIFLIKIWKSSVDSNHTLRCSFQEAINWAGKSATKGASSLIVLREAITNFSRQIELHWDQNSAESLFDSIELRNRVPDAAPWSSKVAFVPFRTALPSNPRQSDNLSFWDTISKDPQRLPGFCQSDCRNVPSVAVIQYILSEILDQSWLMAYKERYLNTVLWKIKELEAPNNLVNWGSLRYYYWAQIAVLCIESGIDPQASGLAQSAARALKYLPKQNASTRKLSKLINGSGSTTTPEVPVMRRFRKHMAWKASNRRKPTT
jgi:hypothetical protein